MERRVKGRMEYWRTWKTEAERMKDSEDVFDLRLTDEERNPENGH